MRFVFAIVSFVLAALFIGLGIAQRTILVQPDHITQSISIGSDATVTVVDGATLNAYAGSQTIEISGSDTIFAAYGRTLDVEAWIGDTAFNHVGFDTEAQALTSELIDGDNTKVPDPAGSDLWLADYTEDDSLGIKVNVPEDISLLIIADGIEPAPASIDITWPLDNSTPWAVPLVVVGGILLIVGLGLLLWAIGHMRSSRGPRRKTQKMPKLPRPQRYKPGKPKAVDAAPSKGRRSVRPSVVAVLPVVLVGSLALGGCSAGFWSGTQEPISSSSTPEPVTEAEEAAQLEPPAVTVRQASRIVARIAATVEEADATSNVELLSTRLDGPALQQRTANYTMRAADAAIAPLTAIPSGPVELTLPQQSLEWPRTVFAVIQDEADTTVAPLALMLIQENPRSQYKIHYAVSLEPGVTLPDVAPPSVGAGRYLPDYKLLAMAPSELAAAYGDILALDTESTFYDLFEAEGDTFRVAYGAAWKADRRSKIPTTATIAFSNAVGTGQVIALATNDTGAIVAVDLNEIEAVTPVEAGAAINTPAAIKALTGKTMSTRGFQAVYGEQLLFYVPSVTTGGKIILLGSNSGLISATEL